MVPLWTAAARLVFAVAVTVSLLNSGAGPGTAMADRATQADDGNPENHDARPVLSAKCADTFDASKIRLVSFDVFGALMLTEDSMLDKIAQILGEANAPSVKPLLEAWFKAYIGEFGSDFSKYNVEYHSHPFLTVITKSLTKILQDLTLSVDEATHSKLLAVWGDLSPRLSAAHTLKQLTNNGIQIALLSNGDTETLERAYAHIWDGYASSEIPPVVIFSSDAPVLAFKPHANIYAQVLQPPLQPEQYLHVAGGLTDAVGARRSGFFSVLSSEEAFKTSKGASVADDTQPCFVVSDLKDLLLYPLFGHLTTTTND